MLRAFHQFRLSPRLLASLALVLLLGAQALESTHLHVAGVDAPECVQCQVEPLQALPSGQLVDSGAAAQRVVAVRLPPPAWVAVPANYSSRAPPVLSS